MMADKIKKVKKNEESICCSEETLTCEPCSFEESTKVEE